MLVRVDHASSTPLAEQIAASARAALVAGDLAPGDRLPSARTLASSLEVNLHTVLRAYATLRDEGLIDLRRGRGAVVRDDADPGRTRLLEAARAYIAEARRLGLSTAEMITLIKETGR